MAIDEGLDNHNLCKFCTELHLQVYSVNCMHKMCFEISVYPTSPIQVSEAFKRWVALLSYSFWLSWILSTHSNRRLSNGHWLILGVSFDSDVEMITYWPQALQKMWAQPYSFMLCSFQFLRFSVSVSFTLVRYGRHFIVLVDSMLKIIICSWVPLYTS